MISALQDEKCSQVSSFISNSLAIAVWKFVSGQPFTLPTLMIFKCYLKFVSGLPFMSHTLMIFKCYFFIFALCACLSNSVMLKTKINHHHKSHRFCHVTAISLLTFEFHSLAEKKTFEFIDQGKKMLFRQLKCKTRQGSSINDVTVLRERDITNLR